MFVSADELRRRQEHPTRRQFLKVLGLGAAAIGAGGLGALSWRASGQGVFSAGEGPANAAWEALNGGAGLETLVRAAVLAANPHNTQPWRFRLSDLAIEMYVDPSRNIGAIDPYRREQHVGLRCSLENLIIASRAKGYDLGVSVLPDFSDPSLIARIELRRGGETDLDLYRTIPRRHTHRAPFDVSRVLSQATLHGLDVAVKELAGAGVVWISSDAPKRQMGQLIVEGAQAISADREQSADSFR